MKNDFLKECISDINSHLGKSVPLDAVQKEYCMVCANPDCVRAGIANGGFFTRTRNWQKILFEDVQKTKSDDPTAQAIVDKWREKIAVNASPVNFKSVDPTPVFHQHDLDTIKMDEAPTMNPVKDAPSTTQPVSNESVKPTTPPRSPVRNPFLSSDQQAPEKSEMVVESGATFTFGD